MSTKYVNFGFIGLIIILLGLAFGGTYYGTKILKERGATLVELKNQSEQLNAKETALIQAKKDVAKYAELEQIAKSIVPQEKNQALTVLQIVSLADQSGIQLAGFQFPDSKLGVSSASSADATTQYTKVKGLNGVYSMAVSVQSDTKNLATYDQMLTFLSKLEHNRHTADITNINVQPSEKDRSLVSFTLTLTVYLKP